MLKLHIWELGEGSKMTMNTKDWINSMYQSLGILLFFYNEKENQILISPDQCDINAKGLLEHSVIRDQLKASNRKNGQPFIVSNSVNMIWIVIPTQREPDCDVCIIGPTLISSISKDQVIKFYCQCGLSIQEAAMLSKEYEKISIIPYPFLLQQYQYIYYVLIGEKPDITNLGIEAENSKITIRKNEEKYYLSQQQDFALSIEAEQLLRDCVRNGKVDWLRQSKANLIDLSGLGPNEIRSLKNTFIIAIALMTRAAMEGGLPVETAYPLSDMYILQLEYMTEVTKIVDLYYRSSIDFATKVRNNKFKVNYSKLINQCCGYIFENVNNPLRVSDIAKEFVLHPDTLSKKFKTETGIAITEYIRSVKVEEAKMFLLHTDKTLTEISNLLSYSSQSHFIVSFKNVEGITPNEFRTRFK